jgi:hypothetical protein
MPNSARIVFLGRCAPRRARHPARHDRDHHGAVRAAGGSHLGGDEGRRRGPTPRPATSPKARRPPAQRAAGDQVRTQFEIMPETKRFLLQAQAERIATPPAILRRRTQIIPHIVSSMFNACRACDGASAPLRARLTARGRGGDGYAESNALRLRWSRLSATFAAAVKDAGSPHTRL